MQHALCKITDNLGYRIYAVEYKAQYLTPNCGGVVV